MKIFWDFKNMNTSIGNEVDYNILTLMCAMD
jgi:hypothetical protein